MPNLKNLKSSFFQTNPELIAKLNGSECHAFLYNNDKQFIVAKGMQADLIYWFSLKSTPQAYASVFTYLTDTYDVTPEVLHNDLEASLRKMLELELISITPSTK